MRPRTCPSRLRDRALLATAGLALSAVVYANPTGPAVVSGSATIAPAGGVLQITNAPNTIINWQSFSIDAGEITRFTQQSTASAVLNRVTTQNPSAILGALESNGRVFLINPNGILFGSGARIDVGGLVASALDLADADFLAGRLRFAGGNGIVLQSGNITTPPAGQVYLVGAHVMNTGQINAPNGEVVLAAGQSVELIDPGTPNLRVTITANDNRVLNLGQIAADAGRIGIFAGLIDHAGTLRANSAVATDDGRIVLRATNDVRLATGSTTSALGPGTGRVEIQSATGDVQSAGATISADPARGTIDISRGAQASGAPVFPAEPSNATAADTGLLDTGVVSGFSGGGFATPLQPGDSGVTTLTSVPTFITDVPTLTTGVPTLTTRVPTLTTGTPTLTTGVPTLTTGVPTITTSPATTATPVVGTTTGFSSAFPQTGSFTATPTTTVNSSVLGAPLASPMESIAPLQR